MKFLFNRVGETIGNQVLNSDMSSVSESIDCSYNNVKQLWTRNEFHVELK